MDRNEINLKTEELKTAMHNRDFDKAVELADALELKKVKDNNFLSLVADAYELAHRYKDAEKVLLMAYENTNAGRHLAYRLCLIAVKNKKYDEAREFYEDFVEMAPRDTSRYILKYKMAKAQGKSIDQLIGILEEYVNIDMEEKWPYELAKLYHMAGDEEQCVDMCDEISLWFSEGKYVLKALELKKMHRALTVTQVEKYEENKKKSLEATDIKNQEKLFETADADEFSGDNEDDSADEIEIKPLGEEKFNTMDIQAVIADGMKDVDIQEENNLHEGEGSTKQAPDFMAKSFKESSEMEEITTEFSEEDELAEIEKDQERLKEEIAEAEKEQEYLEEEPVDINKEPEHSEEEPAKINKWSVHLEEELAEINKEPEYLEEELVEVDKESEQSQNEDFADSQDNDRCDTSGVPTFDLSFETPKRDESNDIGQINVYENIVANSDLGSSTDKLPSKEEIEAAVKEAEQAMEQETEKIAESVEVEKSETELHSTKNLSAAVEIISGTDWKQPEFKEETLKKSDQRIMSTPAKKTEESNQSRYESENADSEKSHGDINIKTEFILTDEDLAGFKNYLNIEDFENNVKNILNELISNYNPNGKSEEGNIIIAGDKKTGKTTLAIEIIKLVNQKRGRRGRKLAKVDAGVLNRRGLKKPLKKLLGSDLVIENAQRLEPEILSEIAEVTEMFTDDMLIILEGEREGINRILQNYPKVKKAFGHIIKVKDYDVKEWVGYGIKYAETLGYSIDELGNLAFHKAIDDFFGVNNGISPKDVEEIINQAIDKSRRFGRKLSGIFLSNRDENGLIILMESDFNL